MYGRNPDIKGLAKIKFPKFSEIEGRRVEQKINFSSIRVLEVQLKELIEKKIEIEKVLGIKQKEFEKFQQEVTSRVNENQNKKNAKLEETKQEMAKYKAILEDPNCDPFTKEFLTPVVANAEVLTKQRKLPVDDVIAFLEEEMLNIKGNDNQDDLIQIQNMLTEVQTAKEKALFVEYATEIDILSLNNLSINIKDIVSELQQIEKDITLIHAGIDILKSVALKEKTSENSITGKKRDRSVTPNRDLFPPCNDVVRDDPVKNDTYELGGRLEKIRKIS